MKKILIVLIVSGIFTAESKAQFTRYVIKLKDKNGTPYSFSNPLAYLSQRAIDRRNRYGIAFDSTDLPVTPSYVNQIKNVANVALLNVSKWLNSVTIQTTDANALTTINAFSFVQSISGIAARINQSTDTSRSKIETDFLPISHSTSRTDQVMSDFYNYGANSFTEIHLHNGEFLHNIGLRGQGMQIAILDNGFNNYTNPNFHAFDSCNANNQVLGSWDFVAHEQNVTDDGNHGMSCFSTIVANIPGQFIGKAPKASFWLFQTEENTGENPIEEHNWACGAERADSSGADIISTSLGYTDFPQSPSLSHTYADMNGNTTMSAIAADFAAKKGMLVFAAVGNDGSGTWHYLGSPSDGDSVIAVGAVSPAAVGLIPAGTVAGFSSYGPSSDGQVKPDVVSIGNPAVIESSSGTIGFLSGTSFACPNMAGLGTCLWQGFPEFNNMKIRSALWQAGDSASAPTVNRGYGLPDMKKAFVNLLVDFSIANGSVANCKTTLNWASKDISAMRYEIERKAPGESNYTKIYDVASQAGVLVLANHSYQKTDSLINVQAGVISYRIRQIVDTAAATFTAAYTDTVNIALAASCITTGINPINPNAERVSIIPNPASNQFTLRVETAYPVNNLHIHIVDMKGRSVLQFERSKTNGIANFDLPVYRLAKGKYIVTVYNGQYLIASKELIRL